MPASPERPGHRAEHRRHRQRPADHVDQQGVGQEGDRDDPAPHATRSWRPGRCPRPPPAGPWSPRRIRMASDRADEDRWPPRPGTGRTAGRRCWPSRGRRSIRRSDDQIEPEQQQQDAQRQLAVVPAGRVAWLAGGARPSGLSRRGSAASGPAADRRRSRGGHVSPISCEDGRAPAAPRRPGTWRSPHRSGSGRPSRSWPARPATPRCRAPASPARSGPPCASACMPGWAISPRQLETPTSNPASVIVGTSGTCAERWSLDTASP